MRRRTWFGVGVALAAVAGLQCMKSPSRPIPDHESEAAAEAATSGATFADQIRHYLESRKWQAFDTKPSLTPAVLRESVRKGRQFLLANQRADGRFNYQYNFVNRRLSRDDNQVRQAGTLWSLVLVHAFDPSPETKEAVDRGLDFFISRTRRGLAYSLVVDYPDASKTETGTVALLCVALVDYLRSQKDLSPERRRELDRALDGYLRFLETQELYGSTFSRYYSLRGGRRASASSSYFDGETLLAMCKAARHLNYARLLPVIRRQAKRMARRYTIQAWREMADSRDTKGFFHWGILSFREYAQAGWPDAAVYEDTMLAMAWWMIHTHTMLDRKRNTGYAYEGIIPAYVVARKRGLDAAASELKHTIDVGMQRLVSWQVGGPLASRNPFLVAHPTDDPIALGGVMGAADDPYLRCDITQHQMHATILALEHVYGPAATTAPATRRSPATAPATAAAPRPAP